MLWVLDPTLKAAVPLTPWHTTKTFATNKVPTLVLNAIFLYYAFAMQFTAR